MGQEKRAEHEQSDVWQWESTGRVPKAVPQQCTSAVLEVPNVFNSATKISGPSSSIIEWRAAKFGAAVAMLR